MQKMANNKTAKYKRSLNDQPVLPHRTDTVVEMSV